MVAVVIHEILKGGKGGCYNDRFGKHVREMWVCRRDGIPFDVLSLGQVLDAVRTSLDSACCYVLTGRSSQLRQRIISRICWIGNWVFRFRR